MKALGLFIVLLMLAGSSNAANMLLPLTLKAGAKVCAKPDSDCHYVPIEVPVEVVKMEPPHYLLRALRPGNTSASGWVTEDELRNGAPTDCVVDHAAGVSDNDCDQRR